MGYEFPSSSRLPSAGDCHAECDDKGCYASDSATDCFACRHYNMTLRNKSGFKYSPLLLFSVIETHAILKIDSEKFCPYYQ